MAFKLTDKQKAAIKMCAADGTHKLLEGGARSAKTYTLVRNIVLRAAKGANSRHCILRLNNNACHQSVRLDTYAKVLRNEFPDLRPKQHLQDGYDTLPNGAEIWFGGLDDKERIEKILGKEFCTMYFNECSQIPYSSVLTALTRLAMKVPGLQNRAYYDLNPTSTLHWTQRLFKLKVDPLTRLPISNPEDYAWMQMNPVDNLENIDAGFIKLLEAMPERYQKRFLRGEPVTDLDGALWTPEMLEECRCTLEEAKDMERIVVTVDPSGCSGKDDERSDEIGISVAGRRNGEAFVFADATMKGSPEEWGLAAVGLHKKWGADAIVGEGNYGGDMVRSTIHAVDPNIRYIKVTATRGKVVRAEPVAALYEGGKVHHVGVFAKLEDELQSFTTNGYKGDRSPNRADALVWAMHELMLTESDDGLFNFYKEWSMRLHGRDITLPADEN